MNQNDRKNNRNFKYIAAKTKHLILLNAQRNTNLDVAYSIQNTQRLTHFLYAVTVKMAAKANWISLPRKNQTIVLFFTQERKFYSKNLRSKSLYGKSLITQTIRSIKSRSWGDWQKPHEEIGRNFWVTKSLCQNRKAFCCWVWGIWFNHAVCFKWSLMGYLFM